MFAVMFRFPENKTRAGEYMAGHDEWVKRGFDDGVLLLSGSIPPGPGGAVLTSNATFHDLQGRVNDEPLVAENVVSAQSLESTPSRTDERFRQILE